MDVPELFESFGWLGELFTGILPTVILNNLSLTDMYAHKKDFIVYTLYKLKKYRILQTFHTKELPQSFIEKGFSLAWVAHKMYWILAAMIIHWCQRDLFIKIPPLKSEKQTPLFAKHNFTGETKNLLRRFYKVPCNLNFCTRKNNHDEYYGNFSCGMESNYFINKSGLKNFFYVFKLQLRDFDIAVKWSVDWIVCAT